ncbi:MAG TPA: serine/threonine-protein kinase [Dongiaceae bacterium]|nr:serine/threonine-protein kinase [Dongiaceae bacterium]
MNDETQTNPFPPDKLFVPPPGHNDISGTTLGNYKLIRKIAQGGMGVIYEATQINLDRKVALKILTAELATRPEFLQRFEREAKSAASLNHPGIVAVYDFGEADGRRFIIMEFIDGENLSEYISKRGKIPVENALAIVEQAAQALKAAAEKSIIHRDIKPSNLMLTRDGRVKVADMGLAKVLTENSELTMSSVSIGSPHFIAPEQAGDSKNADHRVDIYSLGVTLLYFVTGKHAFDGDSPISVVLAHATKPLPTGADLGTELPEEVESLIRRMTAKNPDERYQTYDELLADLQLVQRGYLPMAAPETELPQENFQKKPGVGFAVAIVLIAAIGGVVFFATKKSPKPVSKTVTANPVSTPAATPVASTAPAAAAPPSQQSPPENNFQPPQQQPDNFQPPDEQPPDQQNPPGGNSRPRFPMPMGPPPRMAPTAPAQSSVVADTIKQYEAKMNAQLADKNWQGAYDVWTNFPSNFRSREADQQIMGLLMANLPQDFHPRPPAGFRPAGRPPNQP